DPDLVHAAALGQQQLTHCLAAFDLLAAESLLDLAGRRFAGAPHRSRAAGATARRLRCTAAARGGPSAAPLTRTPPRRGHQLSPSLVITATAHAAMPS